jgi:hypothetical protein
MEKFRDGVCLFVWSVKFVSLHVQQSVDSQIDITFKPFDWSIWNLVGVFTPRRHIIFDFYIFMKSKMVDFAFTRLTSPSLSSLIVRFAGHFSSRVFRFVACNDIDVVTCTCKVTAWDLSGDCVLPDVDGPTAAVESHRRRAFSTCPGRSTTPRQSRWRPS